MAKKRLDIESFKELVDGKNPFDEKKLLEIENTEKDEEIIEILDEECDKNPKEEDPLTVKPCSSGSTKQQELRIDDFVKATRKDAEQQRKKKESWSAWAKQGGSGTKPQSGEDIYGDLDNSLDDDDDIVIVDEVAKRKKAFSATKDPDSISTEVENILQSFGHKTSAAGSCSLHPTATHSEDWCRAEQMNRQRVKKHKRLEMGEAGTSQQAETARSTMGTIQNNPEPESLVSKIQSCPLHPKSNHTAGECNVLLQKMMGVEEPKWEGPKTLRRFFVGGLNPAVMENDLKDVFSRYGQVRSVEQRNGSHDYQAFVSIVATELSAVKCVCQLDRYFIRGCRMRVQFRKDSYEESKDFVNRWKEEFKKFRGTTYGGEKASAKKLDVSSVGCGLQNIDMSLSSNQASSRPWDNYAQSPQFSQFRGQNQMFQKAFPPPSTITNIDNKLKDTMKHFFQNQSIESARNTSPESSRKRTFSQVSDDNSSLMSSSFEPVVPALPDSWNKYERPMQDLNKMFSAYDYKEKTKSDGGNLNNVEGTVHSIDKKCVLVEIDSDIDKFAKILPSSMYLNGQLCLANEMKDVEIDPIKGNKTWPKILQEFLVVGKKLRMDLKKLPDKEIVESKKQGKEIAWEVSIAWVENKRPGIRDLTLTKSTMDSRIVIATVIKLFPSWGVLEFENTQIIFRVQNLFWENGLLKENMSLYKNCEIELGDIMVVHCKRIDTNQIKDLICSLSEGVEILPSNMKYTALLVWQVSAEVDPWVYYQQPKATSYNYLVTSSTISKELPGEKEANFCFPGIRGFVEEIHLPSGGIIKLDTKSIPKGLLPPYQSGPLHERVYFHRSRVYINGSKMRSETSLNSSLVVGDEVEMDLVRNHPVAADPPYVMSKAHWVALSVKVNTKTRGATLIKSLKLQFGNHGEEFDLGPNVTTGTIVFLAPPDEPSGPVTSGIAVIDSGDLLGQGVHFDRTACHAFGTSLKRADISYIFNKGDKVYIAVDPDNSFCVESLWVGSSNVAYKGLCHNQQEQNMMVRFLNKKNINASRLEALVNGGCPPRVYIPLERQQFRGKVDKIVADMNGDTTGIIINGALGEVVRAKKSVIFSFGHWMGKADISWMADEHVMYELVPRYREDSDDTREAGVVWVGSLASRPRYEGCSWTPTITEEMEAQFNDWMEEKSMDMVDGALTKKDTFVYGENALDRLENVLQDIDKTKDTAVVDMDLEEEQAEEDSEETPPGIKKDVISKTDTKEVLDSGASGSEQITADQLDPETLAQAAMLQKMKSQMGSAAVMEALMAMMKSGQEKKD